MANKDDFNVKIDYYDQPADIVPTKKKKKKRAFSNTSLLIYILVILGISIIFAGLIIVSANDVFAFVKPDQEITIEIPEGATTRDIAKILDQEGVIHYAFLFRLFESAVGDGEELYPGKYKMNSSMDYRSILYTLQRRSSYRETVAVTIPEGYTIKQIAELLDDKLVCSPTQFYEAVENGDFSKYEFLDGLEASENRLEGYLFPDTYEFYVNDDAERVIGKMLDNFDNKVTDSMYELAEKNGKTMNEIIIIASMIEREAMKDTERETISGVIENRLNNPSEFPYLNIDATVQYIVGHNDPLTKEDLAIDNPYNTYLYKGLPPGPISNPGLESILAALNPGDHNYYYYVAKPDGTHIFSKTLSQHNQAVEEAEKLWAEENE